MAKSDSFTISRDYTVTPRKDTIGLTVGHSEWIYLKEQISGISVRPGLVWHTVASFLVSASIGTLIQFLTGTHATTEIVLYYSIIVVTAALGIAGFYLAWRVRKLDAARSGDVIQIMNLIESQFLLPDDETS